MRKILIAFIISIVGWIPNMLAQNIPLTISGGNVTVGNEILIDVSVADDLTASNILAYQLGFAYNTSILSFVGAEVNGTLLQSWASPTVNTQTNGLLKIAGANASKISGSGVLLKLRFQTIAAGGVYVYLDTNQPNYFNEGTPTATSNNGFISVANPPQLNFSPENGKVFMGESTTITAYSGTAPYAYSVSDPSIGNIDSDGKFTGTAAGKTRILATDANSVTDSTTGFFEVFGLRLGIRDSSSLPTKTKRIPINLENLNNTQILSGQFQVDVYSSLFTNVAVVKEGSLLANGELTYNWVNNKLSISFANASPISSSGVLCYLDLTTGTTASNQYLYLTNIQFNESLTALSRDALYQIQAFATITLSGGAPELIFGETTQFNVSGGRAPYTWTSSNEEVLTVDANTGVVTAVGGGIAYVTATDADGAKGNSANVTVKDIVVTVKDTLALEISNLLLPIQITTPPVGKELGAFQGTLTYDVNALQFNGLVSTGSLSNGWSLSSNETSPGVITFAAAGANKISSEGDLLYANFILKYSLEVGMSTNVSLSNFIFNEGVPTNRLETGTIEAYTNCPADPEVALTVNGDLSICTDQTFDLNLSATDSADYTYAWYKDDVEIPNTDLANFTVIEPGTYNVKVSTVDGCFNFANEVVASINPYPTSYITFNNDTIICVGESVLLYGNSNNAASYRWLKDGLEIPNYSTSYLYVTTAGSYQVKAISSVGCESVSESVDIYYGFVVGIAEQSATEFCEGGSVLLETNLLDAESYQWYRDGNLLSGQDSTSLLASTSGNYTLRAVKSGCTSESNSIMVTVNAYPVVDAGADLFLCENTGLTQLNANLQGGFWTGTAIDSAGVFNAIEAGPGVFVQKYTISNSGCTSVDSLSISVSAEVNVITSSDTTIYYNEGNVQLSANTSGGAWSGTGISSEGVFSSVNTGVGTFNLVYSLSIGSCTGTDTTVVTVEKGRQFISVNPISNKTILDNFFTINATGGASGEPIVYTALSSNIQLNGNQVTILASGSAQIQVSQAGNTLYQAAENVVLDFTIEKISQEITTVEIPNKTYGDADFFVTASSSNPNQPISYTALSSNIVLSGSSVSIVGTGNASIVVAQAGGEFYTAAENDTLNFFIDKIVQTITAEAITDKTYGDPAFNMIASGGASTNVLTYTALTSNITLDGSTVNIVGVGVASIRISQAGNDFYHAANDVELSFNIAKANQSITFNSIIDKTYGDADFSIEATGGNSGIAVVFEALTNTISINGDVVSILAAGGAIIRASQAGNEFYNAATSVERSFTIFKANQTITFNVLEDVLDGAADITLQASSSKNLPITFNLVDGDASLNGNVLSINGPGTVVIEALQLGDNNHNLAAPVIRNFCVIPVPQISVGSDEVTLTSNYTFGNQWVKDGVNIANATGSSYTATETGTYTLKVTFDNCQAESANGVSLEILGIRDLDGSLVSVYPNPAKSHIQVNLESTYLSKVNSVGLLDLSGKAIDISIVKQENGFLLDVSSLKAGLYILHLKGNDFQYHTRVVKE